jgi:hypothetical protein
MKKNLNIIVFSIFIVLLLSSCGKSMRTANDLFYLKKGLSYSKLDSMYEISTSSAVPNFKFEFDNQKYTGVIVRITNAFHEVSAEERRRSSFNRSIEYQDDFILVFKDNQLLHWGYLYEFKIDKSTKWNQFALALEDGLKIYHIQNRGEEK